MSTRAPLTGVAETTLITAAFRAHDARAARPVLGDRWAEGVLDRLGVDPATYFTAGPNATMTAARGRRLDVWTRAFLGEHPDGQVLHLGCGLDSRPLRVPRPAGSRWIDVDQPEVIALRREVYDLPGVELVAASVTDPRWWADVDPERTTLLVAEGLLMYLPGDEVHALVGRALDHLRAGGTLAFDGVSGPMVTLTRISRFLRSYGLHFAWAADDLAARHPRLRALDDVSLMTILAGSPEPGPAWHSVYGALARTPPVRDALRLRRYRF